MSFKDTQKHEADSWLTEDEKERKDKAQRETIRYPLLKKQMGLNYLDTSDMEVWDIGCGPLGGVSSIINARKIKRIDPLGDEYAKYYPQNNMVSLQAELLQATLKIPDLIIVTNALDHFERPETFLKELNEYMKYGAYFAHVHAINNAFSHPHKAHAHNVNPEMFKEYLGESFELVWDQNFLNDGLTYGWRKQPAFSQLWRKIK